MNRYGQEISWGALSAPHLFTGECTAYSYEDDTTDQLEAGEAGDHLALVLHSQQAALHFEAKITNASTNFLDLSAGAAIAVSGITTGVVLVSRAVEQWRLQQAKTATVQAKHFPDVAASAPAMAGSTLNAFTPVQSALAIVAPGGKIIYGTSGLSHGAGIVHGLTLEQQLTLTPDEPSPDGKILGAASHGYVRRITLELLCKTAPPAVRSTLAITGAPAHAGGYKVKSVRQVFAEKRGAMYSIAAVWIPPFAS